MYLAYFDETYSKKNDENSTGEHAIIALVIPADKMSDLESALDGVVAKARKQHPEIPLYAELHAYELNSGVGSWKALKRKPRPRVRIYQDAISAIARIDGLFVCRGSVDLTKRFCEDPHRWALTFALEHVNYCVRGEKTMLLEFAMIFRTNLSISDISNNFEQKELKIDFHQMTNLRVLLMPYILVHQNLVAQFRQ